MTVGKPFDEAIAPFLKACAYADRRDRSFGEVPPGQRPFVTIMRDAGAGGRTIAHALAEALNERAGTERWHAFDRELVEKVAEDHNISKTLLESLDQRSRTWLDDMLVSGPESSFGVFRRVGATIRALAELGGAIIVGRGGVFTTYDLRGGTHVRLVASFEHRVKRIAKKRSLSEQEAAKTILEIDDARRSYLHRWWPKQEAKPATFAATLNSGILDEATMVEMLVTLVTRRSASGDGDVW